MNIHITLDDNIQDKTEQVAKKLGFNVSTLIGNVLDLYLDIYASKFKPTNTVDDRNWRIQCLVRLGADITKISKIYKVSRPTIYKICNLPIDNNGK